MSNHSSTCLPIASPPRRSTKDTAFGCPRDFLNNRSVYVVVSPRAKGLSVGLNMNPDKKCNFACIYCEVNREKLPIDTQLDVPAMVVELQRTIEIVQSPAFAQRKPYSSVPHELLQLRHVTLSGDGEPTLCPSFSEAVEGVMHLRAVGKLPFFKTVLITNASALDLAEVQSGLQFFTRQDEIWAKLDAGTQAYMDRINRPSASIEKILDNILTIARQRPIVIQSLFPLINGEPLELDEINQYVRRLRDLKTSGAKISLVQMYSATRPTIHSGCSHTPLKNLSTIAQQIRREAGLPVEIY